MANCKECVRFETCKFVEENEDFSKKMYGMFEYLESNNLKDIFYKNANRCKYFIDNTEKIDDLKKKIDTAKYQINWINNYINQPNPNYESMIQTLIKVMEGYKKSLEK